MMQTHTCTKLFLYRRENYGKRVEEKGEVGEYTQRVGPHDLVNLPCLYVLLRFFALYHLRKV